MIVKDESHIIRECLESVSTYIDRYDITDTGSTDGTQQIIKNFFDEHNIPGTFISRTGKVLVSQEQSLWKCKRKRCGLRFNY